MNTAKKYVSGFTLIEIMITVTVVAVLAMMAMPSYSTFIEKRKTIGGAEELAAFMMLARNEAVKHNQQTTVSFVRTDATNWCAGTIFGSVACDCTAAAGDPLYCALSYDEIDGNAVSEPRLISSSEYSGFNLASVTTGFEDDLALTYDPVLGILDEITDVAALTIQSAHGDFELTVNVSAAGTVKTCTNTSKKVIGFKSCPPSS